MEKEQAERPASRTPCSSGTDSDTDSDTVSDTVSEADFCCTSGDTESEQERVETPRTSHTLTHTLTLTFTHPASVGQKGKQDGEKSLQNDSREEKMRTRDEHEADEEEDEMLDNIRSPPHLPFGKTSNPEECTSSSLALKMSRQLNEDGKQFRRGSLGGALTGKYLLPYMSAQQPWLASGTDSSNLVRMRSQSFGKSAPSLTASLKELSLPRRGSFCRTGNRKSLIGSGQSSGLPRPHSPFSSHTEVSTPSATYSTVYSYCFRL